MPTVRTVPRPYLLAGPSGTRYPLSRDDVDRLLAEYPVVRATRNRVVLRGDDGQYTVLPATLGGGPAFEVTR